MNAKTVAIFVAGLINLAAIGAVVAGKATFQEAAAVIVPTLTGIFGLITDADSVVSKLSRAIKKGNETKPKE